METIDTNLYLGDCLEILSDYKVGSGFGKNVSNWLDRKMAYPTNVLHLATETGNRNHSAVFPKTLPEWFIKLFTKENDWVLDPFAGSGTTCQVAQKLLRNSVGIEIMPEYYKVAKENITPTQYLLSTLPPFHSSTLP